MSWIETKHTANLNGPVSQQGEIGTSSESPRIQSLQIKNFNSARQLEKTQWRRHFRRRLQLERPFDSVFLQNRIRQNLAMFLSSRPGFWGSFQAQDSEPQIHSVKNTLGLPEFKVSDCHWMFPKLTRQGALVFYRSNRFVPNEFQIMEPNGGIEISLDEMQGVIVPGLGFDICGTRLGRGKAFYDKTLNEFKGIKIGVCFVNQFIGKGPSSSGYLPRDTWDIPVDYVVTSDGIFKTEKSIAF